MNKTYYYQKKLAWEEEAVKQYELVIATRVCEKGTSTRRACRARDLEEMRGSRTQDMGLGREGRGEEIGKQRACGRVAVLSSASLPWLTWIACI